MLTGMGNNKVLIADDSVILNNLLKDLFEDDGYDVVQAFDGHQAKAKYLQETPDVALLDVQMPKVDGVEVLRFIRQRSDRAIVIMISSGGTEETALKSMRLGADEYLNKPFSPQEVVTLAGTLLERREVEKDSRKLRKQVRSAEKHLAHLTSIINEALITTDLSGAIEFINPSASHLWGYEIGELKGKDVHFLVRGEANTLLHRDLVKDTLKKGRIDGEFHFRKKDKGTFPGYLSTSVIRERDRVRGIVLVVTDLSRLREVERRLQQSEKLASLGRVVEGIAHEVRNCLTSLGGFALRLQKLTSDIPNCDDYTRIMLEDVQRLEKMVREIEDYVRFSKFYTFDFRSVDLKSIVENAHERLSEVLSPDSFRRVRFRMTSEKGLPRIEADPTALDVVFYNLLLNAYEAMPKGGELTVRIERLRSAVSIVLTDTGVGIGSEDIGEIFNPFVTSKTSGAGMGLSKVYLLIQEHGGSIDVTSEPGRGTTFEIFLPIERPVFGPYQREPFVVKKSSQG